MIFGSGVGVRVGGGGVGVRVGVGGEGVQEAAKVIHSSATIIDVLTRAVAVFKDEAPFIIRCEREIEEDGPPRQLSDKTTDVQD